MLGYLFLGGIGVLLVSCTVLFVAGPLAVAAWIAVSGEKRKSPLENSRLYVGQVWHTRLKPKVHAFSYPIFMFALDLEEAFEGFFWPIVKFEPATNHLKNGEGMMKDGSSGDGASSRPTTSLGLAKRILCLVATKTEQKFRPTLESHRIMILTHLTYYGHNFNPVSFYYLVHKTTGKVDAMVGEVSNTPWTEMHCYVLHPDSIDRVQTKSANASLPATRIGENDSANDASSLNTYDYRFPKEFHVSPFMEMEYWYDWTFRGVPGKASPSPPSSSEEISVVNSLRRKSGSEELAFTAKLVMKGHPITPFGVAWQLIRFPVFCMIVQIWIHYQAFWLFLKGIVYVPHPEGSETAASKAIAAIMTPFFAIRDRISPKSKTA